MNAHFFDLNTAISVKNEVWIVSKLSPNNPIVKISQSDFNLIKKGIFRSKGQMITISGKEYFIEENLLEKIKIRCKNLKVEITDLSFSMQEFMNPEIIQDLDYSIWKEHFLTLKNSNDDIYFICSKNTKRNYEPLVQKLQDFLREELGLSIKNFYFISETFYNRDEDKIAHKKVRLLLQHLVGFKTEGDKFIDEEITKYTNITFYDDDSKTINLSKNINSILKFIIDNTEENLKKKIEDIIKSEEIILDIKQTTFNKVNPFVSSYVRLTIDKLIKTYESFRLRF